MADKRVSDEINVKVNVEVSEAITGLKALQREAKAATKALAELREEDKIELPVNRVHYLSGLRDYTTDDLAEELSRREGVNDFSLGVGEGAEITIDGRTFTFSGSARILINRSKTEEAL